MLHSYTGGRTLAEAKKEKREAAAYLEKRLKEDAKALLVKARATAKVSAKAAREAVRQANRECRTVKAVHRVEASAKVAVLRVRQAAERKKVRTDERAFALGACGANAEHLAWPHLSAQVGAEQTIRSEAAYGKWQKLAARQGKARDKEQTRSTAAERRSESDQAVANDVRAQAPQLLPLWHKVKRGIVATPKKSRFEAFMQFVHDTPEQVVALQAKRAPSSGVFACDEARTLARAGNPSAAEWAAVNCDEMGRPVKARRRAAALAPIPF